MTAQQQNEAIAKHLGVHYHKPTDDEVKSGSYYQYEPNYTGDLNAIFTAINQAFPNQVPVGYYHLQWGTFEDNLKLAIGGSPNQWNDRDYQMSTASQRAEALLKTLNLWTE